MKSHWLMLLVAYLVGSYFGLPRVLAMFKKS